MLGEIVVVQLAAMASPGPNVLLVVHTALRSRRAGLLAAAGVATGALIWSAAVALGLGVLVAEAPSAQDVLRLAGGAYLVYLGGRTVLRAGAAAAESHPHGAGAYARGLLTNLSNPKALVYYVSVFGTVLPAGAGAAQRVAAVATIGALALAYHAMLALLVARAQTAYERYRVWIDRVAGTALIVLGVVLALT